MKSGFMIKNKMISMIVILVLLLGIVGIYTYRAITPVTSSWLNYQTQSTTRVRLLMVINSNLGYGGMIHNFKNYVLRGRDKYFARVQQNYQAINAVIAEYRQLPGLTETERKALQVITGTVNNYYRNSKQVKSLLAQGVPSEGVDAIIKINDSPALQAFTTLGKEHKGITEAFRKKMDETLETTTNMLLYGMLAAVGIIMVGLSWLYSSIIPPLRVLNQTMDAVASGDADLSVRLDETRKDELGQLSSAFNIFVGKLEKVIHDEKTVIEELTRYAQQLSQITDISKQSIESQVTHTEQLATAIHELSLIVREVAKSASSASSSSAQADELAKVGHASAQNTVQALHNIDAQIGQSYEVTRQVNKASEEISQVLKVISDIAEQTNLLALNAAIEAARAGEAGRGFAVVADEVRGLAQRTGSSLEEVRKIIEQLQSGASEAVVVMEQGMQTVSTGVAVGNEAASKIDSINSEISKISNINIEIATATEEQSVVAEQMNQNVHEISSATSKIYAGSLEITEQSAALENLANSLNNLAGEFKISLG